MKLLRKPLRQLCIVTMLCAGSLQLLPAAHASVPFQIHAAAAQDAVAKQLNQNPSAEMYKAWSNFWERLSHSFRSSPI